MPASLSFRWKGMVVFYLATMAGVSGQVAASSQTTQPASPTTGTLQDSQNQATLQAFRTEQLALARQEEGLVEGGATQAQINAWRQQHAGEFALQQQRAQAMATATSLRLIRTNRKPNIPANASPALKQFLTTQATLAKARAKIHNQLVQQAAASGSSLTFAQVSQMQRQERELFQQQNASLVALQMQRAQALANASPPTARTAPIPLVIPPNATPQMAAYLTTRNQMRLARFQLMKQYANADPAVKEAALQAWYKQNASQIAQLRQQAENLSQASTTTTN